MCCDRRAGTIIVEVAVASLAQPDEIASKPRFVQIESVARTIRDPLGQFTVDHRLRKNNDRDPSSGRKGPSTFVKQGFRLGTNLNWPAQAIGPKPTVEPGQSLGPKSCIRGIQDHERETKPSIPLEPCGSDDEEGDRNQTHNNQCQRDSKDPTHLTGGLTLTNIIGIFFHGHGNLPSATRAVLLRGDRSDTWWEWLEHPDACPCSTGTHRRRPKRRTDNP